MTTSTLDTPMCREGLQALAAQLAREPGRPERLPDHVLAVMRTFHQARGLSHDDQVNLALVVLVTHFATQGAKNAKSAAISVLLTAADLPDASFFPEGKEHTRTSLGKRFDLGTPVSKSLNEIAGSPAEASSERVAPPRRARSSPAAPARNQAADQPGPPLARAAIDPSAGARGTVDDRADRAPHIDEPSSAQERAPAHEPRWPAGLLQLGPLQLEDVRSAWFGRWIGSLLCVLVALAIYRDWLPSVASPDRMPIAVLYGVMSLINLFHAYVGPIDAAALGRAGFPSPHGFQVVMNAGAYLARALGVMVVTEPLLGVPAYFALIGAGEAFLLLAWWWDAARRRDRASYHPTARGGDRFVEACIAYHRLPHLRRSRIMLEGTALAAATAYVAATQWGTVASACTGVVYVGFVFRNECQLRPWRREFVRLRPFDPLPAPAG